MAPSRVESAYLVNLRFKIANLLNGALAGVLVVFMVASYVQGRDVASGGESEWLLLARSSSEVRVPGFGFVLGPLLIGLALPRIRLALRAFVPAPGQLLPPLLVPVGRTARGRIRQFDPRGRVSIVYQSGFVARYVLTILLWAAGLVLLIGYVGALGDEYVVRSGTYIAGVLLSAGLLSAIAQWPAGLRVEQTVRSP